MRLGVKALAVVALIILIPAGARAQAVIAGTVRDTSGAVLPGVTVEATSPALIEKVRTAVTDGTGQYRIEDLRPGTYTVTFTLPGFSTFKREGIELTGSFTATINAELKVGASQETVTVTGESPIVDVQSARRETSSTTRCSRRSRPCAATTRIVVVVPGVVTNTNDVATGTSTTQFPIHGGRNNEGRMTVDGLNVGNPPGGNQPPGYAADVGNSQEITFTTSGGLGESETGGPGDEHRAEDRRQLASRIGCSSAAAARTFSRTTTEGTGLAAPTPLTKVYDLNGAVGGPIKKDRVWYFVDRAHAGQHAVNANQFVQPERRRPDEVALRPGPERPRILRSHVGEHQRPCDLAGDAAQQDRRLLGRAGGLPEVRGQYDRHHRLRRVVSPEANGPDQTLPLRVPQVTWSSPVTNRLLLDAGFGGTYYGWGNFERDPEPDARSDQGHRTVRGRLRRQRQSARARLPLAGLRRQPHRVVHLEGVAGVRHRRAQHEGRLSGHADDRRPDLDRRTARTCGTASTTASRISSRRPSRRGSTTRAPDGTRSSRRSSGRMGRLTLQGALRFDLANSWFPEQNIGPDRFLPTPYHFAGNEGRQQLQGHHAADGCWPTTCSATARRRSR